MRLCGNLTLFPRSSTRSSCAAQAAASRMSTLWTPGAWPACSSIAASLALTSAVNASSCRSSNSTSSRSSFRPTQASADRCSIAACRSDAVQRDLLAQVTGDKRALPGLSKPSRSFEPVDAPGVDDAVLPGGGGLQQALDLEFTGDLQVDRRLDDFGRLDDPGEPALVFSCPPADD